MNINNIAFHVHVYKITKRFCYVSLLNEVAVKIIINFVFEDF